MSLETESRVRRLCKDATEAKSKEDLNRIIPELQSALAEHIHLAKQSLGEQATAISVLDKDLDLDLAA